MKVEGCPEQAMQLLISRFQDQEEDDLDSELVLVDVQVCLLHMCIDSECVSGMCFWRGPVKTIVDSNTRTKTTPPKHRFLACACASTQGDSQPAVDHVRAAARREDIQAKRHYRDKATQLEAYTVYRGLDY